MCCFNPKTIRVKSTPALLIYAGEHLKPTRAHVTRHRKDTAVSSCNVARANFSQAMWCKPALNRVWSHFAMAPQSAAARLRWPLLGRCSRLPALHRPLSSSHQEKDTAAKVCASNPNHVSSIQQHKGDAQHISLDIN